MVIHASGAKATVERAARKRATCFATLLPNELNSDVARFTTHEKKPCNLLCCKTGSNVAGKTCNIAIQLVLQQCCKKSCTFFVANSKPKQFNLGFNFKAPEGR